MFLSNIELHEAKYLVREQLHVVRVADFGLFKYLHQIGTSRSSSSDSTNISVRPEPLGSLRSTRFEFFFFTNADGDSTSAHPDAALLDSPRRRRPRLPSPTPAARNHSARRPPPGPSRLRPEPRRRPPEPVRPGIDFTSEFVSDETHPRTNLETL